MNIERSAARWLGIVALFSIVTVAAPAVVASQETQEQEHSETGEHHEATEEHAEEQGEGHHHKNHVAVFVGSTEAEERHGEKEDRDFTLGIDYERRLSKGSVQAQCWTGWPRGGVNI